MYKNSALLLLLMLVATPDALAGDGPSTLGAARPVPIAPLTSSFVAADLNDDGRDDLVTSVSSLGLIGVLLARGDGTFANMPALSASGQSVNVVDVTGDGKLDVVCVPLGDNPRVLAFAGRGDGTFGAPVTTPLSSPYLFAGTADVDADQHPDLLLAWTNGVAVMRGLPGGTFEQPVVIPNTTGLPAAADFDVDGMLDVVAGIPLSPNGSYTIAFFPGRGDGTFAEPVALPEVTSATAVGDFDGDGVVDFAGLAGGGETGHDMATVIVTYGNRQSPPATWRHVTMPALWSVERTVADFDGDGRDEIVALGKTGLTEIRSSDVLLIRGVVDGVPTGVERVDAFLPTRAVAGDFNGDGLPDLAIGGYVGLDDQHSTLTIRLNVRLVVRGATAVARPGRPLRITLDGANFSADSRVFVGGSEAPWPQAKLTSPTRLVLKGGAALEQAFPPGVEVPIRVVNPDGRSATIGFTR